MNPLAKILREKFLVEIDPSELKGFRNRNVLVVSDNEIVYGLCYVKNEDHDGDYFAQVSIGLSQVLVEYYKDTCILVAPAPKGVKFYA